MKTHITQTPAAKSRRAPGSRLAELTRKNRQLRLKVALRQIQLAQKILLGWSRLHALHAALGRPLDRSTKVLLASIKRTAPPEE